MKVFGIPLPSLIAIALVGVLIGVGASAPLIAGDDDATGSSKYERPFPLPHGYYSETDRVLRLRQRWPARRPVRLRPAIVQASRGDSDLHGRPGVGLAYRGH